MFSWLVCLLQQQDAAFDWTPKLSARSSSLGHSVRPPWPWWAVIGKRLRFAQQHVLRSNFSVFAQSVGHQMLAGVSSTAEPLNTKLVGIC